MKKTHKKAAFVFALLEAPTMKEACRRCGISYDTGRRWTHTPEVQEMLATLRKEILDQSIGRLITRMDKAIATIDRNMDSKEASPFVQSFSAKVVIDHGVDIYKLANLESKISEFEALLKERDML